MTNAIVRELTDEEYKEFIQYGGLTKGRYYNTMLYYAQQLCVTGLISKWRYKRIIKRLERKCHNADKCR